MTKQRNESPGKAGLVRGELKNRIVEMLTRPHSNFTIFEIAETLGANLNTVKSTKWAMENPIKAQKHIADYNKKASLRRARRASAAIKKLKKQLETATTNITEQIEMFKPEPTPSALDIALAAPYDAPVMLPPPPEVIEVNIKPDMVNSPSHYTDGGIETIDYIRAKLSRDEYIGYLRGNIFKYTSRLGKKDGIAQDAGKLAWYSRELETFLGESK